LLSMECNLDSRLEILAGKDRTPNTNTKTHIQNPIQRYSRCAKQNYSIFRGLKGVGIEISKRANLCRADPLRPAIQTRHDMECDCIALADASSSVQPSVSSLRGIPNICFLALHGRPYIRPNIA
jgi:hypothetical protein